MATVVSGLIAKAEMEVGSVKSLSAGTGTCLYLGAGVIVPKVSVDVNTKTGTTLILETKTVATADELDTEEVVWAAYKVPNSGVRPP